MKEKDQKDIKGKLEELKSKSVDEQIKAFQKEFGSDFICKLEDLPATQAISTRLISLNKAIGIGGIPRGRITELVGVEGCGKTTFALSLVGDAQEQGLQCAYIDMERKLSLPYARALGVSSELIVSSPSTGDHAMMVLDSLLDTELFGLIVIDSVTLLTTQGELDKAIYENNMATTARLMSQSLKRIIPKASKSATAVVFINQFRKDVNKMFGNPDTPTGGKALQYGSTLKIELRKGDTLKDAGENIGHEVKFHLTKNQVGNPYSSVVAQLMYGTGFDRYFDLVDYCLKHGLLAMSGHFIKSDEQVIANSKSAMATKFREDADLYKEYFDKASKL